MAWKSWLEKKSVLIADGGWGTELIKHGLKAGQVPEAWNLDRRDAVRAVAESYVNAGADIILTNTFGGNSIKLGKAGLEPGGFEVNRIGAAISKEAAGGRCLVFGSIGPTGEFMAPLGTITEAEMMKSFADQAKALAEGGVDGIVIETMSDLGEAMAALRGVRESSSLPVVVSMTFNRMRNGYATLMGIEPGRAAQELEKAGADIVGANCGAGIDQIIEVARLLRRDTSLPIWCKANAGLPALVNGETVYRETPENMASQLGLIVEAGATIVGGCCGTTPNHIRAFVMERDRLFT
jgi:5-methyltetrahydrofolate--homocysteine methyltransferase